jgi:hypothetical protein
MAYTDSVIGPCHLLTITIGALTYRLCTGLGFVTYGGNTYVSQASDGQQVQGLGTVTEGASGISNTDLELIATSGLIAVLYNQSWLTGTVVIQEGNRDPVTDVFTALGSAKTWEIGAFEGLTFIGHPVTLVLKSTLARLLEPFDALTTSSTSQSLLVSATDTGLEYISGPVVTNPKTNGGSYPVNTGGGNDRDISFEYQR